MSEGDEEFRRRKPVRAPFVRMRRDDDVVRLSAGVPDDGRHSVDIFLEWLTPDARHVADDEAAIENGHLRRSVARAAASAQLTRGIERAAQRLELLPRENGCRSEPQR